MQKIFANGKSLQAHQRKLSQQAVRAFASSPQANPFDRSVKTTLTHNGASHSFYKLPALGDSRVGKQALPPFLVASYAV